MIESPIYVGPCPTCGAAPMERCINQITNVAQFEFHATRTA